MCGIVGLISGNKHGFTSKECDVLRDMIFMDTMRGADATGIMYGTNNGVVQVHKEAKPGFVFLGSNEWKNSKQELFSVGKWAVAHNRAATRGARTDENAHPFVVSSKDEKRTIILMQNGTYVGSHDHHAKTDVDTEACAHTIVNEADVEKAIQSINAAFVFVWYDVDKKVLNIVRNDERPLYIARTKNGGVIFASEDGIILAAAKRNDFELDDKPYLLKKGCWCQYTMKGSDYDPDFTTIDVAYKHPFVLTAPKQEPPFRPSPITQRLLDTSRVAGNSGRVHRLPNTHSGRVGGLSLGGALMLLKNDYAPLKGKEYVAALQQEVGKNRGCKLLVEGVDYVKRDEYDVNDNTYYVFGIIYSTSDDLLNGQLISWMIEGEEKEVMHYICDNYFYVIPSYLFTQAYNGQAITCVVASDKDPEIACNKTDHEETSH